VTTTITTYIMQQLDLSDKELLSTTRAVGHTRLTQSSCNV